jgi:DNA-binding NarL/FixJ family response regulator
MIKNYIANTAGTEKSVYGLLTAREREVLQMISEGHSTKMIAAELSVSTKTIETYRLQIMEKLNIHSIAKLTKYAIKNGITSL